MTLNYKDHGPTLMKENVSPGNFGGFATDEWMKGTETLYAVDHATGEALQRTDSIGNTEFDGNNWTPCASVPDNAQWIGNYPAPKARKKLTAMQRERGTRITLEGKIGGWQS